MRVLESEILKKYASDTIISVLQRGAEAEDMGEGSVPGRPHRVLFSYTGKNAGFKKSVGHS